MIKLTDLLKEISQPKYLDLYLNNYHKLPPRDGINITHVLKEKKSESTIEYLGCSIKEYIVYLENMFLQNMSWENYGAV
jgi:hypothetical protein